MILENPIIILFSILFLGFLLGKIQIKGISLGSSGVLFVALLFGYFGYELPPIIGKLGLVLFVYCIGISAGPSFFAAFAKQGLSLAKLAIIAVVSGAATTCIVAKMMDIPVDMAAGLFAGGLTSTPGLAAAVDTLKEMPDNAVSIGFGIAYPFGVVGVILFIQLMPKLLKKDLNEEAEKLSYSNKETEISRMMVRIKKESFFSKKVCEQYSFFEEANCAIVRVLNDEKELEPINLETSFELDKEFLVIGDEANFDFILESLGEKSEHKIKIDADNERMQIVITEKTMIRKTLKDLNLLRNYQVIVSRIVRNGITMIATPHAKLEYGDTLTTIGTLNNLHDFSKAAGHKEKVLQMTDILSLSVGIILGILLGALSIPIPGMKSFSLGSAGGPLFVALILGYFGRIWKLSGQMPQASKMLLMELGLVFFLASSGIKAGLKLLPVLQEQGLELILAGAIITIVPMLLSYFIATKVLKLNIVEALGGICGGMTSTPSLGVLSSKVDSQIPVTSYATAYPVALILMTIIVQIVITILSPS